MTWYIPAALAKQRFKEVVRKEGVEIDRSLTGFESLIGTQFSTFTDAERVLELMGQLGFERGNFTFALSHQMDLIALLLKVLEGREDPAWIIRVARARQLNHTLGRPHVKPRPYP
jgi:hypothetical protein